MSYGKNKFYSECICVLTFKICIYLCKIFPCSYICALVGLTLKIEHFINHVLITTNFPFLCPTQRARRFGDCKRAKQYAGPPFKNSLKMLTSPKFLFLCLKK